MAEKRSVAGRAGPILLRREMAVFLPAVALAGLWFGLEAMTLVGATALTVAWMTRPYPAAPEPEDEPKRDSATGLPARPGAQAALDAALREAYLSGTSTAALVLGLDDADSIARHLTQGELEEVLRRTAERLKGALRDRDIVARLSGLRFAVALAPSARLDLEGLIQLAGRLQSAAEVPLSIASRTVNVTAHVGFCQLSKLRERTGAGFLAAAEAAADEACRNGQSAIRAYSVEVPKTGHTRDALSTEIAAALEDGTLQGYLQPQLSTDTGDVSGFNVVPRWLHPTRGMLAEKEILPAISAAGLGDRMAEVMLYHAFHVLRLWDKAAVKVGPVSLPMPAEQLENPKLAARLQWEFDRFEIAADRFRLVLPQEVLPRLDDEVIRHNLAACAAMGCGIDLASFGHGPASMTAIRRSGAQRLRIHRSFVQRLDANPEQQRLIAAIISLAEGLGLETVADGVSSIAEHSMLSQLGCRHVQGPAIARPMPAEDTLRWMEAHRAKLAAPPQLGRGLGK